MRISLRAEGLWGELLAGTGFAGVVWYFLPSTNLKTGMELRLQPEPGLCYATPSVPFRIFWTCDTCGAFGEREGGIPPIPVDELTVDDVAGATLEALSTVSHSHRVRLCVPGLGCCNQTPGAPIILPCSIEPRPVGILTTGTAFTFILECIENADKIFLGGLALIFSPVITAWFAHPFGTLYLMLFGLCCAIGGLFAWQL